jgi:hypothetical protein
MSLSLLRRAGNGNKWRDRFHQQLEDLKKLPPGSDSWSPHCPLSDVLTAAREIGEDVGRRGLFVSIVAATSDGGIQLKWQDPHRELSLLIYPNRSVEYLFFHRETNKRESGELLNVTQAGDLVSSFLK